MGRVYVGVGVGVDCVGVISYNCSVVLLQFSLLPYYYHTTIYYLLIISHITFGITFGMYVLGLKTMNDRHHKMALCV